MSPEDFAAKIVNGKMNKEQKAFYDLIHSDRAQRLIAVFRAEENGIGIVETTDLRAHVIAEDREGWLYSIGWVDLAVEIHDQEYFRFAVERIRMGAFT